MRRLLGKLILLFVALTLMLTGARGGQGDELPFRFELIGGGFGERNGVFQGRSLVEIGPDGKLWLLGRSPVLTIDPVDGIFFNGDDVRLAIDARCSVAYLLRAVVVHGRTQDHGMHNVSIR